MANFKTSKKLVTKQYFYLVFVLLILSGYFATGVLWRHQQAQIKNLDAQIATLADNQATANSANYTSATISPSEGMVYFPLAQLKLPASALTETMLYSYVGDHTFPGDKKVFPAELSISTHDLAANSFSTSKQFDCSEVAYADFVSPSYPVNPSWKSDGKINLADGRVMHIYYAPSIPGCEQSWELNHVDSKAIADSLKLATSY